MSSRDHIMPVAWGGSMHVFGMGLLTRKLRWMCRRCNSLRADVGHCVGAAACVLAVSGADHSLAAMARQSAIVRRWDFAAIPMIDGKTMREWIKRAGLGPGP